MFIPKVTAVNVVQTNRIPLVTCMAAVDICPAFFGWGRLTTFKTETIITLHFVI